MAAELNYTETTGPIYRVAVIADEEQEAIDHAMDQIGTDTSPAWVDYQGNGEYVVNFERADLS